MKGSSVDISSLTWEGIEAWRGILDGMSGVMTFRGCLMIGYWRQRADERHGSPPARQPGAFSGQKQSCKPQVSLGLASPWYVIPFPSVLRQCRLHGKGIWSVQRWVLVCCW